MPRFVFTLEPVLELRRRAERAKQVELGVLERERLAIEAEIRAIQEHIEGERRELSERLGATSAVINGALVRLQAHAVLQVHARARRAVLRLAGVTARLERTRSELLEATVARRGMEVVRERRFDEWRQEQNRRDAVALDEISTQRAARALLEDEP